MVELPEKPLVFFLKGGNGETFTPSGLSQGWAMNEGGEWVMKERRWDCQVRAKWHS